MGREPSRGNDDDAEFEHVVDEEWEAAAVRRSPRHGRIILVSVLAALVIAAIHTAVSSAVADPLDPFATQPSGIIWTFGVLALVWVALALLIATTTVITLDRMLARRIRPVIAEHSTIITDDLTSPMTDEVPSWLTVADEDLRDRRDRPPGRPPEG